jgi:hypothetical protein
MSLSRRGYARHRGVSETAVRKAIASGRIVPEADGSIDPAKADAAWAGTTDPSQQRSAASHSGPRRRAEPSARSSEPATVPPTRSADRPVPTAAVEAVRETLKEIGEAPNAGGMTFVQARTANEVMKAQERRVRLQKLKGELVDRGRAVATVFGLARRERDAWVQWPARVAALIAADLGADPHAVETALEKHVRRHLAELGEVRVELR